MWRGSYAPVQLVAEFHEAFNHPVSQNLITPSDLTSDLGKLRQGLIAEEFNELIEAWDGGDVLGVIDALQDLKYVIYGTELALGIASEPHFMEVHAANMNKLGPDGKPIYREDGKVLKPEGWTGPDHQRVITEILESNISY